MDDWQNVVKWSIAAHLLLVGGGLLMLVLVAGMLRQRRNPATSAAWLMFMLVLPYIGVPLYLLFGTRKLAGLKQRKSHLFMADSAPREPPSDPVQRYLQSMHVPPPVAADAIRFHAGAGEARRALLDVLHGAHQSLDVCVFILANDAFGREVLAILSERARDGVQVRLLLDGFGSFLLPKWRLRALLQAGGRVAWFIPVLHRPWRGRTNMRNHRKLAIADGRWVWAGGRNIAADYLDAEANTHWHDLSFDLQGAAALHYWRLFDADWRFAAHEEAPAPVSSSVSSATGSHVQLIPSGPDMVGDVLHELLVMLVAGARERIQMVSPYYVPGEVLQTVLAVAARRGIAVDLILPANSNHWLADLARNRYLRQLVEAGASVWLFPDAMLHAKAVVIDGRYALAGSANLDLRSLFLNFELMTLFYTPTDIGRLSHSIEALRGKAVLWKPRRPGVIRETLEGLVLLTAYQL